MKKNYYIYSFISIIFIIIVIRLFYLCFILKDDYQKLYKEKTNITVLGNSAPRGRILDRSGNILVDNKGVKTIYYNKIKGITISEELDIAKKLASIINIKEASMNELKNYWLVNNNYGKNLISKEEYELYKKRKITSKDLQDKKLKRIDVKWLEKYNSIDKKAAHIYALMNKGYSYEKKEIIKNITDLECAKIVEEHIKGITIEMSWERVYLYDETLKSILGSVGSIPKEEINSYLKKGYNLNDIVGISYLEKQYESFLKGEKSIYKLNKDNTLKEIKKAKRGSDLVLSIDINIQKKVEEILKEKLKIAKTMPNTEYYHETYAMIANPIDGSIIAISGIRLNDDNTYSEITSNTINSSFIMGSTVKAATMSVGYKYKLFEVDKYVQDRCIKLYLVPIKCSHKNLGRINDLTALAKSSNYFQFMIAINLTNNKYYPNIKLNANETHFKIYRDMLESYGLGTKTNIDLPGEVEGIKGSMIADDLLLNLTIGQYDAYTPVEVLQYINTIASSNRVSLSLGSAIKSNDKIIPIEKKTLNKLDLDEESLNRIRLGLSKVLSEGTGKGYINEQLKPVGKSGTSETFYKNHPTNSQAFAGYFPIDNPKYSIVVITPDVFNKKGRNDLRYYAASKITREITDYLSEYNY